MHIFSIFNASLCILILLLHFTKNLWHCAYVRAAGLEISGGPFVQDGPTKKKSSGPAKYKFQ